jgi:putative hydrolase of the HAD superfamily
MRYQAVCFDIGGVLIRVARNWGQAADYADIAIEPSARGKALSDMPDFDIYQSGALSGLNYLDRLSGFLVCTPEEARKVHDAILQEAYPGALELVLKLKDSGIHTGCLSNTNHFHWQVMAHSPKYPEIRRLELPMASHLLKLHKPDPAIYLSYAKKAEFEPEVIVFFDDHMANVEGANRAGFTASLIDHEGDTVRQMSKILVDLGVLDLAQVLD